MLYVIHCLDKKDALPRRLANYDAHKAYLGSAKTKSVISGPLVAADGETMIGSMFIVEAKSLEEVQEFHNNDPFKKADVWGSEDITPFLMSVDNRK